MNFKESYGNLYEKKKKSTIRENSVLSVSMPHYTEYLLKSHISVLLPVTCYRPCIPLFPQVYSLLHPPNPRWNPRWNPRRILGESSPNPRWKSSLNTSSSITTWLRGCGMGHHRTSLTKGARITRAACNYPTYITLAEEPTHPFERIYFYLDKLLEDLSQSNLFE